MSNFLTKVLGLIKKVGLWLMQYIMILVQWIINTIKIQFKKTGKSSAKKALQKAQQSLGAEVYAHYKQGVEMDWSKMPGAEQQIRRVEEAEKKLFAVDESIDTMKDSFAEKRSQISKSYEEKRAKSS